MQERRQMWDRGWRLIAPLALGLLAAACAGPEGGPALVHGPASGADTQIAAGQDDTTPTASRTAPAARPARFGAAPVQPAVFRLPGPAPRGLLGMNRGEVGEMLGRPTLLRREQPSEVWQYRAPECVLFVFFFDAEDKRGALVEYVEARQRGTAQPMPEADCLRRMAAPNLVSGRH
ncbi:MAG: hypothetical protein KIT20_10780 [Alphaproteobacteria bacterium]|nr:hypothetical protein [Alphaproteobacteria bacterium]